MRFLFLLIIAVSFLFGAIDINSASKEEFIALNGIGTAKAAKIINYRDKHECFNSIDELTNIDGISMSNELLKLALKDAI